MRSATGEPNLPSSFGPTASTSASGAARIEDQLVDYELSFDTRASWMTVVGESHYQPAISRAVKGRYSDGGIEVSAYLFLEPDNPYDPNAVRIVVNESTVGYIPRAEAPLLGPRLRELADRGLQPVCRASVFGGSPDKPTYGIWLHTTTGLDGFANARPDSSLGELRGNATVTVLGEEDHQDVLEHYLVGGMKTAFVHAALGFCRVRTGKHVGKTAVEVQVDGHRVGQLSQIMTSRYLNDVAPSGTAPGALVATAILRREKKIEAYLLLPRRAD